MHFLLGHNCLYKESTILSPIGQCLNPIYFMSETPTLFSPKALETFITQMKNEYMAMKLRMQHLHWGQSELTEGLWAAQKEKVPGSSLFTVKLCPSFLSSQLYSKFPLNWVSACEMTQKCCGNIHSHPLLCDLLLIFASKSFLLSIL